MGQNFCTQLSHTSIAGNTAPSPNVSLPKPGSGERGALRSRPRISGLRKQIGNLKGRLAIISGIVGREEDREVGEGEM